MTRSLGQIAWEGYMTGAYGLSANIAPIPYEKLSATTRAGWEHAARAVSEDVLTQVTRAASEEAVNAYREAAEQ